MSPLPQILLVLLALLGATPSVAASMTTSVWHHALVSQDQLAASATSKSYQVYDKIICAILATDTPWCHLFIHEGNTCDLYDVVVDSLAAPPTEDTATPCKTRHRNVCIVEGKPVPHGDTLLIDCLNTTCWNRTLVPTIPVLSTCDAPFSRVSMGCVHLCKKEKTWHEARDSCEKQEAKLAVVPPESFSKLQEFLVSIKPNKNVWVGVKERKWMDGRNVVEAEWHPDDPNGAPEDCARMIPEGGTYLVADMKCDKKYWVLCMRT